MHIIEISQKLDSIDWGTPQSHYPARGQAPEIYATRLKRKEHREKYEKLCALCGLGIYNNHLSVPWQYDLPSSTNHPLDSARILYYSKLHKAQPSP